MYEISLVPDVKTELIKKLKLRNLVFLICIIVAASCGGVFMILLSITGGQGLVLSAQDEEMACRSDGVIPKSKKKCDSKFGTAIMKTENEQEILTIQDQMKNLALLNKNKIKFSRVFNILDAILPSQAKGDENTVKISEINTDINNSTLFFDALGYASNNIGYRALEAFKKSSMLSYYDYGNYMRKDDETGEYVAIPSYCITEESVNGIVYGVYHKGSAGCEAPMVEEEEEDVTAQQPSEESESTELAGDLTTNNSIEDTTLVKQSKKKDIRIRRTYNSVSDRDKYKEGNDFLADSSSEKVKGYYFESKCLQYDGDGKFDEDSTLNTCPLLSADPYIGDSAYGRDSEENMVLTFSATLNISRAVFLSANKHMMIVGPTRQNVTDSYLQISGMFTEAAHDVEEVK